MADAERFDLSVPEIVDKLFEGATIKLPMDVFIDNAGYKAFVNNLRTAKSRMTKKFRALGMEFPPEQAVLSIHRESRGFEDVDLIILKLMPPKQPKYTVLIEQPAAES